MYLQHCSPHTSLDRNSQEVQKNQQVRGLRAGRGVLDSQVGQKALDYQVFPALGHLMGPKEFIESSLRAMME